MALNTPNGHVKNLRNRINNLEDRIRILERFLNLDDETIERAREEKGEIEKIDVAY